MYPRRSHTTHTEQLGDEASVYDWAGSQVHALNPTAARVWGQCDGATSPEAMAAALARDAVPEAEAVVDLTLSELGRLRLLDSPVDVRSEPAPRSRRWLLSRGVAAAALPAIASILAPTPLAAQSLAAPTLSAISLVRGTQGATLILTLTGTRFIVGGTTVTVTGGGVTVSNVVVTGGTSLTVTFVLGPTATPGVRTVTVTTPGGTSEPRTFTVEAPGPPTLTGIVPPQGFRPIAACIPCEGSTLLGGTVAVTLTGTNFVTGATTVNVGGTGVTVTGVTVTSSTTLTANFVIDPAATPGARTVTVTTAAGTSGPLSFTVEVPAAPTLTAIVPGQGGRGTTVIVTLTGTNFIVGATTVHMTGSGVTVNQVTVNGGTSLTATCVIDPATTLGARSITVTTAGGTSNPLAFTVILPVPTLAAIAPAQGIRGTSLAVTLTGSGFAVGATTVAIAGAGVGVSNVLVGNTTVVTATFTIDVAAAVGPRAVTVTTAGGTSGAQPFTISLP